MSKSLVALAVLGLSLFVTQHADAEPMTARGYASVGGEVGTAVGGFADALAVSGGYRLATDPIYAHAQVATGSFDALSEAIGSESPTDFYRGSGRFLQVRAGVEYLPCSTSGWLCGVFGADLGVLRTTETSGPFIDTESARYTQAQLIPRIGLDMGDRHLRLRTTAELAFGTAQRDAMSTTTYQTGAQGVTLGAAVAYRF